MACSLEVLFYSDQSVEPHQSFRDLIERSKQSYQLQRFLNQAWVRLSDDIRSLPYTQASLFSATDFFDLEERSRKCNRQTLAVSCVLHTVTQIGFTILHLEQQTQSWISERNVRTVGLCTGIISAIAASAAQSTSDLAYIGPEFVSLSLRLGLAAMLRAENIECTEGAWSVAISGMLSETGSLLADAFNHSARIPSHRRVYISAISSSSFTASGPPNLLSAFLSTEAMLATRKLALPISGPFHASHLKLPDIDQILSHSDLWNRVIPADRIVVLHFKRKQEQASLILRELLRDAIYDIFQKPMIMEELNQALKFEADGRQLRVNLMGPGRLSGPLDKLQTSNALGHQAQEHSLLDTHKDTSYPSDSIAIIGMAGKFPDAEDLGDLWNIIINGRDLHREIPVSRFDVKSHCDPTGKVKNTSLTPYGCFYDNADKFDLSLFKMSPREAAQTDPIQRLMLITAYMALESAGYYDPGPRRPRPRFGTYYGQGGDDYRQVNSSQDIDSNYITGGIRAFGPGRVSYHFGWEGPSMVVDTACSASAVAIHQAVSALRLKECDTALAGGANFLSCSDMFAGLSRASFLSLTGGCKTLDENADGYCRADGVATIILKRLDDAVRDKDNVLGVIREVGTNHAANAISITHPHAETQAELFNTVLRSAGLTIDDIDHVEMHGTGTQAGDVAEATSIASLLGGKRRPESHPLYLGAIKPNVGHSEAASGATSLIKGVLMLRNEVIPRHTGIKTRVNPKLPSLDSLNIRVPVTNLPYSLKNGGGKRRILVNNFNATGGSTALLLEEFHAHQTTKMDTRDHFPITLSAASPKALSSAIKALRNFLVQTPSTACSHLSYTLTARRMHHSYRFSCTAANIPDLISQLETALVSHTSPFRHSKPSAVIFIFTGQGSHYAGMGQHLWRTCRTFRSHIESTDLLSQSLGFKSFLPLIQNNDVNMQLVDTFQTQLALVALEIALAHTLCVWGIQPLAVIGHSLGEYSALAVSGVLSLADTLYLVGERAQLMLSRCERDYSMLAVTTSEHIARNAITTLQMSKSAVACFNSPTQTVISGPSHEIENLRAHFADEQIKATILGTRYAFHSAQMDPILADLKQIATQVSFRAPKIPIASTFLGVMVEASSENVFNAGYITRQTREPVQFVSALRALQDKVASDKSIVWVELGPTSTCLAMVASTLNVDTENLTSVLDKLKSNWHNLSNTVSKIYHNGGEVFWDQYHKEHLDCLELIDTPSYVFDLTSHFIPYNGEWAITKNQLHKNEEIHKHQLRSSTVHSVENHVTNEESQEMRFMTNAERKDFQMLAVAHKATSTVAGAVWMFADMSATAASCLWQTKNPNDTLPAFDVLPVGNADTGMAALQTAKTIELIASQAWSAKDVVKVRVVVTGPQTKHQGDYKVVFDDRNEWQRAMNKNAYLYRSRIDDFTRSAQPYATKDIASSSTVQFLADTSQLETVATVRLGKGSGNFVLDPTWHQELLEALDQLVKHSVGNSSSSDYAFAGWHSLRLLRKVESMATYHVHAKIQAGPTLDPILSDIHVLDANHDIVAILEDVSYCQPQCCTKVSSMPVLLGNPMTNQHAADSLTNESASVTDSELATSASVSTETSISHNRSPKLRFDFEELVALIASEIGVNPSFMHEDSLFADMGVDSLLQISIATKMKQYTGQNLPNSLLVTCPSIRLLRIFFENLYENEHAS